MDSPASSSFASLPRDNEGFDDLDAYFNRASTPQKTPRKSARKSNQNTPTRSRAESGADTPLTQRKNANVLLAKPVKMIASKLAERYKKEPRLAVSMSEAIEETREREREIELEAERANAIEQEQEELVLGAEDEQEQVHEVLAESHDDFIDHNQQDGHVSHNFTHTHTNDLVEDRIQRAKRELEEMSINSFDTSMNYENNDTEVHLSAYIKSTLSNSVVNREPASVTDNNKTGNTDNSYRRDYDDYAMPDDDVLMDRLVEEMLVNDSDLPDPVSKNPESDNLNTIRETHESKSTADDQEEEDEEDEEPVPVNKTAKTTNNNTARKPRKPRGSGGGLSRKSATYLPGAEYTETGQRRSCRLKIEPLRYWANEKVCYGRAADPSITLPVIVNVIKKPELDDPTFAMGLTKKRRRPADGNVSKLKAQAFGPDCDVETEVNCYDQPGEEEVRLVALSHHHVQGDPVNDCSFRIHTIFTEGSYMSSGQLIFPPLSQKPTKNSARHALVFYVITGSFRVEINKESFLIGPGGQFHVPRANHYTITHVTEDRSVEGRLFFCHCKDNAE